MLAVLLSGVIVWSFGMLSFQLGTNGFDLNILFDKDQWMSRNMNQEHVRAGALYDDLQTNRSKESILAGEIISEQDIVDAMYDDYQQYPEEISGDRAQSEEALTDKQINAMQSAIRSTVYQYVDTYKDAEDEIQAFTAWIKNNRMRYAEKKEEAIQEELTAWTSQQNWLRGSNDYLYYAENTETGLVETNLETSRPDALREIENCPLVYQYDPESGSFSFVYADDIAEIVEQYIVDGDFVDDSAYEAVGEEYEESEAAEDSAASERISSDTVILIGLTQTALDAQMNTIDSVYRWSWSMIAVMGISALLLLLCCIILCCGAGRASLDAPAERIGFDRIWTEVQIVFVFAVLAVGAYNAYFLLKNILFGSVGAVFLLLPGGVACLTAALCLPCLMSQARRLKTRSFWRGFICFRGVTWLICQWKKGPRYLRVILLAVFVPLLCMIWIVVPFVIAALLYFGVRYIKELETIVDGVHRIRGGETDLHIAAGKNSDLAQLTEDINGISDGLHNAVDTAVKSERLKSELISNVSHDLKTPLTGIVTYVDLMKQLEPEDPKMREYLATVDQKTQRLSTLINDLLEASKASSGAIKLERTRVDFDALLQQACGEMQTKLDANGLDLRKQTQGRTDVYADGRLLWRVLDNLLSNCARYAEPNSRVYLELCEKEEFCVFTIKNISANELNIPAEELMERFTRGDRARHTEGSGLGLSIARSLTERMDGRFELTVDGDLFKAEVAIPLWNTKWEATKPLEPALRLGETQQME